MCYIVTYRKKLFQAAEPVEGHGAPAEVLAGLEAVGGALEGDAVVSEVVVAVTEKTVEPEEKIEDVEGDDEEEELLP